MRWADTCFWVIGSKWQTEGHSEHGLGINLPEHVLERLILFLLLQYSHKKNLLLTTMKMVVTLSAKSFNQPYYAVKNHQKFHVSFALFVSSHDFTGTNQWLFFHHTDLCSANSWLLIVTYVNLWRAKQRKEHPYLFLQWNPSIQQNFKTDFSRATPLSSSQC